MKILVPDSVAFELPAALADDAESGSGVVVVRYDPDRAIPAEHEDAAALVVWGVGQELLTDAARRLTRLRWVQLLSAGADAALAAGFGPGVTITSGRSLHDAPVAEHALALILAAARRLHTLVRAQVGHRWAAELGGRQDEPTPGVFTTLRGANVVIWGFGSIGRTLAPLLRSLGANVTGVATRERYEDGIEVVTPASLPRVLPDTDVLVMILPASPETAGALDAGLIALLPPQAWVVNVGRGATVVQADLAAALRAGRIGGAALDVTDPEPLPVDSELWDLPNLILTPHAAGGRPLGAAALIGRNLAALLSGGELRNVVQRA